MKIHVSNTRPVSVLASFLCLIAMTIAWLTTPTNVKANEGVPCYYAGQKYSHGACRPGQRCNMGDWVDDPNCQ